MKKIILTAILVCAALICQAQPPQRGKMPNGKFYVATVWGARSDGETNSTASIQRAVDEISANGGGVLLFTVGRYLTGSIELKDNVTIAIGRGAVLVGSENIYDYKGAPALIWAKGRKNVHVTGDGTIEGRHEGLKAHIDSQIGRDLLPEGFSIPELCSLEDCTGSDISQKLNLRNNTAASFK